jgi:hypothetical protein
MPINQSIESNLGFVEIAGVAGPIYNEAAFRYFLALELKRANRSARRLLLVLVSLRKRDRERVVLPPRTAAAVFSALTTCVREVDFVGWHRDGLVAAALLAMSGAATAGARQIVWARVGNGLDQRLTEQETARLLVRVAELGQPSRV